ncbi:MAG: tetratricopeptide repeat protein [Candidatus Coatesbacteria bacterium]|nr:MAG: tetratricopeptide repeat protein [Candidatus Coatesbacteria bacterium]
MGDLNGVIGPSRRTGLGIITGRDKYPIPDELVGYFEAAARMIDDGEAGPAIKLLEGLLDDGFEHPWVGSTLERLYFSVKPGDRPKENSKASETLLAVIERYPDYAEAYRWLSVVYSWSGINEEAAAHAGKALELDRNSPDNWNAFGLLYLKQREYDIALDYFLAAYDMENGYTIGAYNIACCYANMNEPERALEYLGVALESKKHVGPAETDEDLEPIRDLPGFKRVLADAKERFGV